MNFPVTSWRALAASCFWRAFESPRFADSFRAASAAWSASWSLPARRRLNSSVICPAAVLMKVPGPKTTLAGLSSAIFAQPGGSSRRPCAGTLPDRQPSSLISFPRSGVSTVFWRLPFTSTTTASSPKSRLNSSVAFDTSDEGETRVSVPALGSRRRASAAPASPSTATTTIGTSGRRVTARTIAANRSPFTRSA